MKEEMVTSEQGIMLYAEVGLSENTFYRNVREGKIRKFLPAGRQRDALYNAEDIRNIVEFYRRKRKGRVEAIRTIKEGPGKTDWVQAGNLPYPLTRDYEMFGMLERMIAAKSQPSARNSETLSTFTSLTQACWKLTNSGELVIAEMALSSFLPTLKQAAPSQPEAALLASQGLQLRSVLVSHNLKIAEKLALCQQAVEYARLAQDHNTLVAELTELAVAYVYNNQYDKALTSYQEALTYCGYDDVSPLLRSRTYVEAGAIFAHYKRIKEADFYLDMAYEAFPVDLTSDPAYLYADHSRGGLAFYNGLIQLEKGEAMQAWSAFESFKEYDFVLPERIRVLIVNQQGRAAILGNDLEKYAYCLEEGIAGAVALKSKKRFAEAYSIFQQEMPKDWLQHHKIKPIVERYHLLRDN